MEFLEVRNLLAAAALDDNFVYLTTPQLPPHHLPVLHNDEAQDARIVDVGEADHGGTVRIIEQGRFLSYSPQTGFEGTETFEYSIRTPDDESASARVQVLVTRPAVIKGTNWADRNGDGKRQEQEPGINDWPIYLDTNKNGSHDEGERMVRTDVHGRYAFMVRPGDYRVAEVHPQDWTQTVPENGTYDVNLNAGDLAEGLDFANRRSDASLHGTVWADRNGDGKHQQQEHGVPGWPVYLDTNNNGSHDAGERLVHTDSHGHYGFVVEAGQYTIAQGNRPGWEQTAPENKSHSVDVEPGQQLEGLAFGNQPQAGSLHGTVWLDRNGNGEREHREPGMLGWIIYLDNNNNAVRDEGERAVRTGPYGHYNFGHLEPGEYVVRELKRHGWRQTSPNDGYHQVVIEPGGVVEGVSFGNHLVPRDGPLTQFTIRITDDNGKPISKLMRGERFFVDTYVEDLRETPLGVSSAQLDIVFDDEAVDISGSLRFVSEFSLDRSGTKTDGMLDDVGAKTDNHKTGSGPVLLARAAFRAMLVGEASFDSIPAHESLTETRLFSEDHNVPTELIEFLGTSVDVITNPYVNPNWVHDVDNDSYIAPKDVVTLINELNHRGSRKLPRPGEGEGSLFYIDVNMDGYCTPIDAMWVINDLNQHGARELHGSGEGEGSVFHLDLNMDRYEGSSGLIGMNNLLNSLAGSEAKTDLLSTPWVALTSPSDGSNPNQLIDAVYQVATTVGFGDILRSAHEIPTGLTEESSDSGAFPFSPDDFWTWDESIIDELVDDFPEAWSD